MRNWKGLNVTVAALSILSTDAFAEVTYGDISSDFGRARVTASLTNPNYPEHFISLSPQNVQGNAGSLMIACVDNKTNAYYATNIDEYLTGARNPQLKVRFPSEESSKIVSASGLNGEAAFFQGASIGLIQRLIGEGAVVIGGVQQSGSFAASYEIDGVMADAIYSAAETCGWQKKLPPRDSIVTADNADDLSSTQPNIGVDDLSSAEKLMESLERLVEQHGFEAVQSSLHSLKEFE